MLFEVKLAITLVVGSWLLCWGWISNNRYSCVFGWLAGGAAIGGLLSFLIAIAMWRHL